MLLCTALFAVLGNAFAQKQSISDTIFSIEEVEVVGVSKKKVEVGKFDVPVEYLPLSVSSVSGKDLDTRGIVKIEDATRFLPNTRTRTTYGGFQQIQVRGFDFTPVMLDGIRDERTSINNSAPIGDLSSIESIELLKGPASVLYGHSSVGGIINITRKAPTSQTYINTELSYGSWENKRAMMDFGGKFVGPVNYRAVVNWSDTEGYRYTNDKRFSAYLALAAPIGKNQELAIRGGINRDWYGTEIGLPRLMSNDVYNLDGSLYLSTGDMLPNLNRRWRYNNESDFLKNHSSNISIDYKNKLSESFTLENKVAYNYDNIDYFCTEELSYLESDSPIYNHYYMKGGAKRYIAVDTVQLTYPLRFAYTVHTLNEQIEGSGKITFDNGMKYNYLAGYNFVYFYRNTYRGYGGGYKLDQLIEGPGLYSKVPVYNPHSMGYMQPFFSAGTATRNHNHSVYLQNLIEFSDKFKAMLSGRFDSFHFKTATAKINRSEERKYDELSAYNKTSTSAFTYRVGAVYLPIKDLSVYGSFANFFMPYRDIVNNETNIYLDADGNRYYPKSGEQAFKPEKGYQAELGIRYSFNTVLQATASTFYIKRNNEKKTLNSAYIEDTIRKSVVGQIGSTDAKGFELELNINPITAMQFSLGYGYTDAKIRKLDINTKKLQGEGYLDPKATFNEDDRLAGVPRNTFFGMGNYAIEKGFFKGLGFFCSVTYTDIVYRDLNRSITYPAYWLTDLGASYALENGLKFRVNVNNVFNKKYFNQSLGTQIVPANPTNYMLTIAYNPFK